MRFAAPPDFAGARANGPAAHNFSDRLLAEALRLHEDDGRAPIDDPLADLHAQAVEGDLETKIIVRARATQIAGKLRDAMRQVRGTIVWIVVLGVVIAFIIGAGTARATLGTAANGVVNFYWVFLGILGVQTIALLAWLIVMLIAGARRSKKHAAEGIEPASIVSLGAAVMGLARWLAARVSRDAHQGAAIAATARIYSSGPLGRWMFSSITHGLWLSFNAGCLVLVILLLTARHYTFVWETTILRSDHYVTMTRAIAWLPEQLRFPAPSRGQVHASQWPVPGSEINGSGVATIEAREAWAGLLVGSIVAYGIAPRLLLLGYSLGRRRTERKRFRLDVSTPGFARLEFRLMPRTIAIGKVSEDGEAIETGTAPAQRTIAQRPVSSSHAILGLEIARPEQGTGPWPPTIHGVHWDDFGIIEDRSDQHAALQRLESSQAQPASVVIVCALTSTPDRGMMRFVREVGARLTQPVALVLTAGQSLRSRGFSVDDVAQRVRDWRDAAARAGVSDERIIELDLDHLTDEGRSRLKRLLGEAESGSTRGSGRQVEQAFKMIVEATEQWSSSGGQPPLEQQAELHRKIAQLYSSESQRWRDMLGAPSSLKNDVIRSMRESATRVQALLPDRLVRSPRWIAAGALSGALGCVAAATLISPIAIGALPMWSAIGGAIAAVGAFSRGQRGSTDAEVKRDIDLGDAVRSAALFALLLELQGRDEATITRVLDDAIEPDAIENAEINSAESALLWLDAVRHRFDMSLAGAHS